MKIIFTICSNNYLAQASVLAESVRNFNPEYHFFICLVDQRMPGLDYEAIHAEIIDIETVEPGIKLLAEKFSIVELNTCVKPSCFRFFFDMINANRVIYMDPDTFLLSPMSALDDAFAENDIILTPHILSPLPMDGFTPDEPLFLNYGLYNLGFLAVQRSEGVSAFLRWWNERTYEKGYNNPAKGLFTDQLWINLVPVYFERVHILRHKGYNMAPWNLHERFLVQNDYKFFIDEDPQLPLVFYHFSGFSPYVPDLHNDYNRFLPDERPDLLNLYATYRESLIEAGFELFRKLPCYFVEYKRKLQLKKQEKEKLEAALVAPKIPGYVKLIRRVKSKSPQGLKKLVHDLIKA
ncbi:hypothetical protein [Flavihumibacter sp. ZG627]|uniref:hypothetical protein n=1 Tax=Flavihumibacter sp. ZG627 TaxID=1463156 RepID=UPI000693F2FE|nr:hypothetical protein [Flavihumibacter sp. ZG627]